MTVEHGDLQRILSRRDVASLLGVSPTTLWRLVRDRHFPPPMQVSPGRVGWRATTVGTWIDAREAASLGRGEESEAARGVQPAPTVAKRR